MSNIIFFSFKEEDRENVLTIKGRATNNNYKNLDFRVRDLLKRWDTEDEATIKQAISKTIKGTSRTIVFVGNHTNKSYWVPKEVQMTLEAGKDVYAIRLKGTEGKIPKCLYENNIPVYEWSEEKLQYLATLAK
ncbi:TIR domain-containing protein [Staphylococcus lloydii]|uniref:TIR domain-containing protein n=1 Tax=Staphylococcus TaxID=1279 RepID=UPI001AEC2FDD|nr:MULTISPECIES: TIR domain-containing protein [Staphylococcus]MDU9419347.1 TIR domain-containing protein [Staphylococcus lloydii]MDW4419279.1 TIR domain-containing protein [Staphylococcus saprophyticus]